MQTHKLLERANKKGLLKGLVAAVQRSDKMSPPWNPGPWRQPTNKSFSNIRVFERANVMGTPQSTGY